MALRSKGPLQSIKDFETLGELLNMNILYSKTMVANTGVNKELIKMLEN